SASYRRGLYRCLMYQPVSSMIADLIGLLPQDERRLLLRLCTLAGKSAEPVLTVPGRASVAARRLAARLSSTLVYRAEARELTAVSAEATGLLRYITQAESINRNVQLDPVAEILAAQEAGNHRKAFDLFKENGGFYFIHFHGKDACLEVLNRF